MSDEANEPLAARTRRVLEDAARQATPITYQELARRLALEPPGTIHRVTRVLEGLMQEDAASRRPFIAALVVSRARGGLPAPGFFDYAHRLGRLVGDPSGPPAEDFYWSELRAAVEYWGGVDGTLLHPDRPVR